MKQLFIIIALLFNNEVICQNTFLKVFDTEDSLFNEGRIIIKSNDTLYIFQTGKCINGDDCLRYFIHDLSGNLIFSKTLSWLDSDLNNYSLSGDTVLIVGTKYGDQTFNYLYRQNLNGDSIDLHIIKHPNSEQGNTTYLNCNGIFEFNKQLLWIGLGFDLNQNDSLQNFGLLMFMNKDFAFDTLISIKREFDNKLYNGFVMNDSTFIFYVEHDCDFECPDTPPKMRTVYSINKQKEIKELFNTERVNSIGPRFAGKISDTTILVGFTKDEDVTRPSTRAETISGNLIWENSNNFWTESRQLYNAKKSHRKNEVTVVGRINDGDLGTYSFLETAHIQRIDGSNGDMIWERTYGRYNGTNKTSAQSRLFDFVENEDGSLYLTGFIADKTWDLLLMKVDSFGCVDQDKCNDHYVINPLGGLHKYDQVDMKQKKWYYSVRDNNGKSHVDELSMGQDTIMFDPLYGPRKYKHVWINGEKDTFKVRWNVEGKLHYMFRHKPGTFELIARDSVLYDFTLMKGDKFQLPQKYGYATVAQVDSIDLLDGYKRKRIILKHDNPLNQNKYGDLVWIEGIGSPNGLFYFYDWINSTKTSLNCYYDRDMKRWGESEGCQEIANSNCSLVNSDHKWIVDYYPFIPIPISHDIRIYMFSTELFDFNGNQYKNLQYVAKSTGLKINTNAYYREVNNIVYKLENNVERIVYNFNLQVGDSIVNDPNISHTPLYVTNIDTIVFEDNKPRKRLTLNCKDENKDYYWVECIGGFPETFNEGICTILDSDQLNLRCFFEDNFQVYQGNNIEDCLITSTEDIKSDLSVRIYPNPTNYYISVKVNNKIDQIKVFNSFGQIVKVEKSIGVIDLSNLIEGIYILEIESENKKFVKKIVKI